MEADMFSSRYFQSLNVSTLSRIAIAIFMLTLVAPFFNYVSADEELTYKVSYGILRLGTVKMITEDVDWSTDSLCTIQCEIKSNPLIPFVHVDSEMESIVDRDGKPVKFTSWEYSKTDTTREAKVFDHKNNQIIATFDNFSTNETTIDTMKMPGMTYDGISAIYGVRTGNLSFEDDIYSFYKRSSGKVDLKKSTKTYDFNVRRIDREFEAHRLEGKLHFEGIAGWTGKLKAWVNSTNPQFILAAHLKILVGSIKIRLETAVNCEELQADLLPPETNLTESK